MAFQTAGRLMVSRRRGSCSKSQTRAMGAEMLVAAKPLTLPQTGLSPASLLFCLNQSVFS